MIGQHVVHRGGLKFAVQLRQGPGGSLGRAYRVEFDRQGKAYVSTLRTSRRAVSCWAKVPDGPTARAVAHAAASAAADSPPPGGPAANLWAAVAARYVEA